MKNVLKGFLCGLTMAAFVIIPACRPKQPVKTEPSMTTRTETTATVPQVETKVEPPRDFVSETATAPPIMTDELGDDIEIANRTAQDRGLIQDAYFAFDESALTTQGQTALNASANWLRRNPKYNLLIEGHCDERGTEQYNLALGDRRANAAKDFLETLGINGARMRTVSYGEERPFDEGHSEAAWARNRRAHLVLVGTTR